MASIVLFSPSRSFDLQAATSAKFGVSVIASLCEYQGIYPSDKLMLALHGETSKFNTGKIEVVDMGKIDGTKSQDCRSWHEKEGCDSNSHSRRRRNAGYQSESLGNQPKRINRTNCKGASYLRLGSEANGGVVDNLIDDYRNQVAVKRANIRTLELEIEQIESRIKQFEAIQAQFSRQLEEAS